MPPGARNLFTFGNNANPRGRPRKTDEQRRAERLMQDRSYDGARDLIALSEQAEDEAVRARLLMFRWEAVHGKATQAITGPEGEPLTVRFDFSQVSDDDLRRFVEVGDAILAPDETRAIEAGEGGTSATAGGVEGVAPDSTT